jgi:hypothetical protein
MTDWPEIKIATSKNGAGACVVCDCQQICQTCEEMECPPRTGFYAATFEINCNTQYPMTGDHFYSASFDFNNFWGARSGNQLCGCWEIRNNSGTTSGVTSEQCGFGLNFSDDWDRTIYASQADWLAAMGINLGGVTINQIITTERTDDHDTATTIYLTMFSEETSIDMTCQMDTVGCGECVIADMPNEIQADVLSMVGTYCGTTTLPCYRWVRACEYNCFTKEWESKATAISNDCDAETIVYLDDPYNCRARINGTVFHNPPPFEGQTPLDDSLPLDPDDPANNLEISQLPDVEGTCCVSKDGRYKCKYILNDNCDWTFESAEWLLMYTLDPITHEQIDNPEYEAGAERGYYDGYCIYYILGPEHDTQPASPDCNDSFLPESHGVTFDGVEWDSSDLTKWSGTTFNISSDDWSGNGDAELQKVDFCVGKNGLKLSVSFSAKMTMYSVGQCQGEVEYVKLASGIYVDGSGVSFTSCDDSDLYGHLEGEDCIATQSCEAFEVCLPCGNHSISLHAAWDAQAASWETQHDFTVEVLGTCEEPPPPMLTVDQKPKAKRAGGCGPCAKSRENLIKRIADKKDELQNKGQPVKENHV